MKNVYVTTFSFMFVVGLVVGVIGYTVTHSLSQSVPSHVSK